MSWLRDMWHTTVANAQVGITYFWLVGYFGAVAFAGFGRISWDTVKELSPITMLVMTFWFQRQRTSTDQAAPSAPTVTAVVTNGSHNAPTPSPASA